MRDVFSVGCACLADEFVLSLRKTSSDAVAFLKQLVISFAERLQSILVP